MSAGAWAQLCRSPVPSHWLSSRVPGPEQACRAADTGSREVWGVSACRLGVEGDVSRGQEVCSVEACVGAGESALSQKEEGLGVLQHPQKM